MRQKTDGVVKGNQLLEWVSPVAGLMSIYISLYHVVCGPLNLTRAQHGGPMHKALHSEEDCFECS
jgi:hypothetical protein